MSQTDKIKSLNASSSGELLIAQVNTAAESLTEPLILPMIEEELDK